ncbi:MAG: hypothetical protein EXQ81_06530 [Thermoleophilia bacterium]|nr:hypothetical protein [Thermoleophilia bacterium]
MSHTLHGTVVAKDRANRGLVVALPGGNVQTLVAPAAFGRTDIGRRVVIRYTGVAGRLPVALSVSLRGHASRAVVRGTIVRLLKRNAIINAGGSLLRVTLKVPAAKRTLASAKSGPSVGDSVKVEVEIDDDDSLDASAVTVVATPAGPATDSEGEMEVRGTVTALSPTVPGTITVTTGTGVVVTCVIPPGVTRAVTIGDRIELKCELLAGTWTIRTPKDGSKEHAGKSSKMEVQGTIAAAILPSSTTVSVLRRGSLADIVICAIVPGSLARFALGDDVKMECATIGTTLTLTEIEKKDGGSAGGSSGSSDDEDEDDDEDDDSGKV